MSCADSDMRDYLGIPPADTPKAESGEVERITCAIKAAYAKGRAQPGEIAMGPEFWTFVAIAAIAAMNDIHANVAPVEAPEKVTMSFGMWQPIETAPRTAPVDIWIVCRSQADGYAVVENGKRYADAQWWPEKGWCDNRSNPRDYSMHEEGFWATSEVTHWMPLPPRPGEFLDDRAPSSVGVNKDLSAENAELREALQAVVTAYDEYDDAALALAMVEEESHVGNDAAYTAKVVLLSEAEANADTVKIKSIESARDLLSSTKDDEQAFDEKIERDAKAGKLDMLEAKALKNYKAGRADEL